MVIAIYGLKMATLLLVFPQTANRMPIEINFFVEDVSKAAENAAVSLEQDIGFSPPAHLLALIGKLNASQLTVAS